MFVLCFIVTFIDVPSIKPDNQAIDHVMKFTTTAEIIHQNKTTIKRYTATSVLTLNDVKRNYYDGKSI